MGKYNRHTMGNDWGGRHASNPKGCDRVSGKQVRELAASLGIKVKREGSGWSMWFYWKEDEWWTLADTNYLAFTRLQAMNQS